MTELEAARLVRAALILIRDKLPGTTDTAATAARWQQEIGAALAKLEQDAPPWQPEPAASTEIPWREVACGDEVQAPTGTWYPVDSIARLGSGAMSVLLVLPTGGTVKSTPSAGDKVPVRRGATGQAMDLFRAGGLDLETITSGAAA